MNLESLVTLRDDLQARFDEQTRLKADAENEQLRLQGEHRLLVQLIGELETKAVAKKVSKK